MIALKRMKKFKKENKKTTLSAKDKEKIIKKYKNVEMFKNVEDESIFWLVMIFYLSWMQENENERLWKDFKNKIKYKSHFFPQSKLIKKIDKVLEYASVELDKGTILYRAREYKDSDFFKNEEKLLFIKK